MPEKAVRNSVNPQSGEPSPLLFWETVNAYQRTATLRAAIDLEVFTAIGQKVQTADTLASRCEASERGIRILCDFLTVAGFLEKENDRYRLTPTSAAFLDKRSPAYMGGILSFINSKELLSGYDNLIEVVRKGTTLLPGAGFMDPEDPIWVEFARSMVPLIMGAAEFIAELATKDYQGPMRVLDIAAGHGMFGIAIAKRKPKVEIVAQENARAAGVQDRLRLLPGDVFKVDLGKNYEVKEPDLCVSGALPRHSAWRVLLAGTEPGRLIESNVITSLNPESAIEDTSWIRAGKSAWDWWSGSLGPDGERAFTTENMKHYVDFAAQSGLEYMLVDAGWSSRDNITQMNGCVDIPELVRYADSKGVKVWIWLHWSGVERQMNEAFPLYKKWGVAGVKIDFMSRDDQEMIDFYYRVAEKAARHRLLVDFHGSTKPWGMERTYPNVLGYEAVLGMEQSKAGARDNPDWHVMLPFTRMLAGRVDYTPGGFDNVTRAEFEPRMRDPMVMGTRAYHLAMYVVYESPFQMVSDHPSAYQDEPAFEFIKRVPATWDETRVLDGQPGEFITMARRRGEEWFLGSGRYLAEIYADADDADRFPRKVTIEQKTVNRTTRLKARLAPAGGYAVRLRPVAHFN